MRKGFSDVGALRERIVIQNRTLTTDGMGGSTEALTTFGTVWARIEPVSANQMFFSMQLQHRVTHKITIRKLAGIGNQMRISFENRTFQVHAFRDIEERGQYTEIMCEEGAGS